MPSAVSHHINSAHHWSQRHVKSNKNHPNPSIGFMDRSPFWSQLLLSVNLSPPLFPLPLWHTHPRRPRCSVQPMQKSVKGVEWQLQPRYFTIRTWTSISLRTPIPADRIRVTRRVLQSPIAASLWAGTYLCPVLLFRQRWTYSLRRSACLHFTHALARSHSNQEDPASLCRAGKRRHQRTLIWILGGGAFVAAFRELPGLNKHPGTCGDAKWSLVSTGCSEVQINYQLPACESGTLWFSFLPQRILPRLALLVMQANCSLDTLFFTLIWTQSHYSLPSLIAVLL